MKSLDKKVSSSSYMLWLYLKRRQCIESEFFRKLVDGCLLQEAENACPKPGAQEEQLCSSQVSCLGQGSMSTWNLHHHLNHTLDTGYLGAFISLSRWPRSSRGWVLNRCAGGCPHMCLRGSLWLGGWALSRTRSQTQGQGGGRLHLQSYPVLANFSGGPTGGHFMIEQWPRRENRWKG